MGKVLRQASFPRTPTGASFARHVLADALRGWMSEEERIDFALAVGEVLSNAVRHGGGETFSVRCWSGDDRITVDVIDEGTGFRRSAPRLPADGETGGYGMLIIYKLTDEVHLLNGGRRVRLVKRLPATPAIPYRAG
jgi:serine/threonine-protein kinase RsbW